MALYDKPVRLLIADMVADLRMAPGQVTRDEAIDGFRQRYPLVKEGTIASKRIECDEIWQFCYAKAKNVPEDKRGKFGYGDVWTWTALDADSKLIVSWLVGSRDAGSAYEFMQDVASRISTSSSSPRTATAST